jgi:hypothetical protein
VCTLSYKDNAFFEDSDYYQWLREVHGPATMEFDLFVRLSLKGDVLEIATHNELCEDIYSFQIYL